jgi:hypothetical protein
VYIIISVDTRVFTVHRTSQDVETWEVFLYPINIFVITSRCKDNLVEKIFATHIIKVHSKIKKPPPVALGW